MKMTSSLRNESRAATIAIATVLAGLLLASAPAFSRSEDLAYAPAAVEDLATPEGAAYARVRDLEGSVRLLQERELIEGEVSINTPIAPGDILESGPMGRVEVQLADGTILRVDRSSRVSFLSLADQDNQFENRTLLSLESGSLSLQTGDIDPEHQIIRVDTEAASIFLLSNGLFRIDAGVSGGTRVASRTGVAEVLVADESTLVRSGEGAFIVPGQPADRPRVINTRAGDGFDDYVGERRLVYLQEARGARRSYAAYEDDIPSPVRPYLVELDHYGRWDRHPSYGVIWVPAVEVGWRPYYQGYWLDRPIGWSWVSSDPWGYAPYHYGRWEYLSSYGWCWLPGALYAPAWVSWGYHGSSIGWTPLGWYNYPSGWSLHLSFGNFHSPYWSFVHYNNFHHRHVSRVYIKDDIVARDVVYASRQPAIRVGDFRERRERSILERSRRDAAATNLRAAADAGARPASRSFREQERRANVATPQAGRNAGSGPLRSASPRSTVLERRVPTAGSSRGRDRIPGRSAAPVERGPSNRLGAEPSQRGRTEGRRPDPAGRSGADDGSPASPVRGRAAGRGTEPGRLPPAVRPSPATPRRPEATAPRRPTTGSAPVEGSRAPVRRDAPRQAQPPATREAQRETRRVPDSAPRRLLSDIETRRSDSSSRGAPRATPTPSRPEAEAQRPRPQSPPPPRAARPEAQRPRPQSPPPPRAARPEAPRPRPQPPPPRATPRRQSAPKPGARAQAGGSSRPSTSQAGRPTSGSRSRATAPSRGSTARGRTDSPKRGSTGKGRRR